MNYFTAVDISADFKFFSLVGFMNSEQIIFSTPFYYYWECWYINTVLENKGLMYIQPSLRKDWLSSLPHHCKMSHTKEHRQLEWIEN